MTAVAAPKVVHSASSLRALLRERYPNDSHVTLEEVRDAAGFSASRSCDALTLGTWPSRGLILRGFEIKVSRSDWLRELRDAAKAESFAPFCDEWYLVVSDAKIVQADELPDTWGLLVARGANRLECAKPATKNPAPAAVDRGLLVAMLKRAKEQGPTAKALETARANGAEEGKRAVARETQRHQDAVRDLQKLEKAISDFEQASGVRIGDRWGYHESKKIGEAVRAVLNGNGMVAGQLERMLRDARVLVSTIEPMVAAAKASTEKTDPKTVPETSLNEKGALQAPVNPSDSSLTTQTARATGRD